MKTLRQPQPRSHPSLRGAKRRGNLTPSRGAQPPSPPPSLRGPKARSDLSRKPHSHGFTLIEVLVALSIVAITLAAGLRAAGAVTDNAQRLSEVTAAHWCADNQLAAVRLAKLFPGVGDSEFTCEQLGQTYAGTLRTQPTPNPNFRRVDALIRNAQGQPLLTLSTIVGR